MVAAADKLAALVLALVGRRGVLGRRVGRGTAVHHLADDVLVLLWLCADAAILGVLGPDADLRRAGVSVAPATLQATVACLGMARPLVLWIGDPDAMLVRGMYMAVPYDQLCDPTTGSILCQVSDIVYMCARSSAL